VKKKAAKSIRVTIEGKLLDRLEREKERTAYPEGLASLVRVRLSDALPPETGERRS
jgi:hypothetical protein